MRDLPAVLNSGCSESPRSLQLVVSSDRTQSAAAPEVQGMNHPFSYQPRDRVLAWLQQQVPQPRLQHILRVEQMAVELAWRHGLDTQRAAQAGLMHDLAKCFKPQKLLAMARAEGLELDAVEQANPHLLHAEVGAIVAQQEFGVEDPEVLWAIRNHTLGRPDMSPLSCVVFLADSLEPGRGDTPELTRLRQVCQTDLYRAVWLTSDYTLQYLLSIHCLVHPQVIRTRNWAMQRARQLYRQSPRD
jgi:predicted HD superfamily hydrolase involved in NAD metabolism